MKPPSKKLWIALIAAILIVVVISIVTGGDANDARQLADSDVVFINNSTESIAMVSLYMSRWDGSVESTAGMNADGTPLKRGDKLHFDVRGWPAIVTVYGDWQGREPLAEVIIEEEPPSGELEQVWYVIARDSPKGMSLTLSLNLDDKDLEQMAESISGNLGVDVTGGTISYCWYPGHGWQGDGEDFVTMQFSQAATAELERQMAEVEGWEPFPVPEGLKQAFVSVYDHESHIDWERVSASGWFYFRDEQENRHSAQSSDLYDAWDYVAAVYDSAARALYFFEWHQ